MGKPIGQTVIKGMTVDMHLKTAEGRKLLSWIANQPIIDDPAKPFLAPWAEKRNEYIREKIGEFQDTRSVVVGKIETQPALQRSQINGIESKDVKLILQKLDTILDLLSKNGKGWDDE